MTTSASLLDGDEFEGPRWLRGPAEGWLSLVLVAIMLVATAAAIDDARWAGTIAGGGSETGFLPALVLIAGAWGFVSGKSRLPALVADVLGAVFGTVVVLVAVAGVVSHSPDLGTRLEALSDSIYLFYRDLVIEGVRSSQTSVFLLVLGAAVWSMGQVGAFSVYRRHRPLSAVGVIGLALLVELCIAAQDQYVFLVVFCAAALLLLVRLNLQDQQAGWLRRSIGDAGQVGGRYLRAGAAFIALAMVGAMVLTATASSAPLSGVLDQPAVRDQLVNWGQQLNLVVGGLSGGPRFQGGLFTSSSTITGVWESSPVVVFRDKTSDGAGYRWFGAAYDVFDGTTWKQADRSGGQQVPAAQPVLAASRDAVPPGEVRVPVTADVTDVTMGGATLLTPESVYTVDRSTILYTSGQDGPLATVELATSLETGQSYRVDALVRPSGKEAGAPTQAALAAAGTAYPDWVERYRAIQPGSVGPLVKTTADGIVASLATDRHDPFHVADAIQTYLYSRGGFTYNTDVRGLCSGSQVVDCFLQVKQGYCEYFATAMVMLLREEGIPARYVKGYLPGRKLTDGTWEVDRGAAHAWVQVFFPGYGWIDFDPTPGNGENGGQQPAVFEPGAPVPSATPEGVLPSQRLPGEGEEPSRRPDTTGIGGVDNNGGSGGPLAILVVGVAAVLVAALAWRSRARRRRPAPEADSVYRGLTRLAGRLGFAPLPTQTAYEYAGALGELLPAAREELQLVARAKVEGTYAHRPFQGDRLAALHAAYRRLRFRLLRLAFRRRRGFR
ncbi:MAG TPA: transglutaminaseTgpA domain-containing protein [Candidatus Dormibacteraeota bacterium]|nr:transglutaminaseTgpA domain-containing protein [Candidatus Dormibacteraeota bacterium]